MKIIVLFLIAFIFMFAITTEAEIREEQLEVHYLPYQYSDPIVKYAYTDTFVITKHSPRPLTETKNLDFTKTKTINPSIYFETILKESIKSNIENLKKN